MDSNEVLNTDREGFPPSNSKRNGKKSRAAGNSTTLLYNREIQEYLGFLTRHKETYNLNLNYIHYNNMPNWAFIL